MLQGGPQIFKEPFFLQFDKYLKRTKLLKFSDYLLQLKLLKKDQKFQVIVFIIKGILKYRVVIKN